MAAAAGVALRRNGRARLGRALFAKVASEESVAFSIPLIPLHHQLCAAADAMLDEELPEDVFSSQSEPVKVKQVQSLFFGDDDDDGEKEVGEDMKKEEVDSPAIASTKRASSEASYSQPSKRLRKASEDTAPSHTRDAPWDRRFVGTFIVQAWSLSKGSNYVKQGDRVQIQRQKPKPPGQQQQSQGKNGKTVSAVKSKQTRLVFNTAAATPKKAKVKEDYVVRFSNMRGE